MFVSTRDSIRVDEQCPQQLMSIAFAKLQFARHAHIIFHPVLANPANPQFSRTPPPVANKMAQLERSSADIQQLYKTTCQQQDSEPDAAVLNQLCASYKQIELTTESQLHIVLQMLSSHQLQFISKLYLNLKPFTATAIQALTTFLRTANRHVTHLSLSRTKIGNQGVVAILTALSITPSSPLISLTLSDVGMTKTGALAIAALLKSTSMHSLSHIDLSNNFANQRGVLALQHSIKQYNLTADTPLTLNLTGNLIIVELLNAVTHGLGAGGALLGGAIMTARAVKHGLPIQSIAALLIFIASLFTLMMSSCVYHSCFRKPKASKRFRKADHCSIFVLIAGTYTPFVVCYTLDPPTIAGPATLASVWLCATIGIVMSLGSPEANKLRALFALATGWLGAFSFRTMLERMQDGALSSVVLGGVTYSLGIVFYLLGKKIPAMHVVWHVAVMIGGALHYFALWRYVVNG